MILLSGKSNNKWLFFSFFFSFFSRPLLEVFLFSLFFLSRYRVSRKALCNWYRLLLRFILTGCSDETQPAGHFDLIKRAEQWSQFQWGFKGAAATHADPLSSVSGASGGIISLFWETSVAPHTAANLCSAVPIHREARLGTAGACVCVWKGNPSTIYFYCQIKIIQNLNMNDFFLNVLS